MWQTIILSFLAGVAGGNAVPHFVKGITKERYPSALGGGPVPNLLGGWILLIIAGALAHRAIVPECFLAWFVPGALGVLGIGLFHAWHGAFGKT